MAWLRTLNAGFQQDLQIRKCAAQLSVMWKCGAKMYFLKNIQREPICIKGPLVVEA